MAQVVTTVASWGSVIRQGWFTHNPEGVLIVAVAMPIQTDWLKSVLIERGFLARIKGEAIKVYLVMLDACGGVPDQDVTMSLAQMMSQTRLSCPTVVDSLARLEKLGLVISTTPGRGRVKTYHVADPIGDGFA